MTFKEAMATELARAGIILIEAWQEGDAWHAVIDESCAEEPLCPLAFDRFVGGLSWRLLGTRLAGRFELLAPEPAPAAVGQPAPAPAAAKPARRRAA
jgi:hypothetical protein